MADSALPPRDSAGRFSKAGDNHDQVEDPSGPITEPPVLSNSEREAELAAAAALKDAVDRNRAEQDILRVNVKDEEVWTILTVAMMAKFTTVWADDRLKCSDSPD